MWSDHEWPLVIYIAALVDEYEDRSKSDDCRYNAALEALEGFLTPCKGSSPPWLNEEFASNHRSILLGKVRESIIKCKHRRLERIEVGLSLRQLDKEIDKHYLVWQWYQQWNWKEKPAIRNSDGRWPYLWPGPVKG